MTREQHGQIPYKPGDREFRRVVDMRAYQQERERLKRSAKPTPNRKWPVPEPPEAA